MSDFNTLYHGDPERVLDLLEARSGHFEDFDLTQAAITNAFKHINTMQQRYESEIQRLENQIERLTERMESGFADLDVFP